MKKLFITLFTVIVSLICFLGLYACEEENTNTNKDIDSYDDFNKFRKEFAIEGLDDDAVPQGIAAYYSTYTDGEETKSQQYFLTSAYMIDGSPSRIYVTGETTGYIGYVALVNIDGTPHKGKVSGIATNGRRLWVTYEDSVLVAEASEEYKNMDILREIIDKATKNKKNSETLSIKFTASFKANCSAEFLYYFDDSRYAGTTYDRLYIGESTCKDGKHFIKTPTGNKNITFMYEYNVDGSNLDNPYGLTGISSSNTYSSLSENVPKIQNIYSLPEDVQGVAFSRRTGYSSNDGILLLSQSHETDDSHILCFDWGKVIDNENRVKYSLAYDGVYETFGDTVAPYADTNLYLYYVDKGNDKTYVNDYLLPPTAEGMCSMIFAGYNATAQPRVFVLFASGSKQYDLADKARIKDIYSFIPESSKN